MHRRLRGPLTPLALAAALVLGGGLLLLGSPGESTPDAASAPRLAAEAGAPVDAPVPPGTAGLRYSLNRGDEPVLGAAALPLELDEETRNALRRDETGLVPVTHDDGTVSIHLQGRYQSASVARIGADGTVTVCVDDPASVEAAATPSTPSTKWEVQ
jgi:hypothetical protein